MTDGVHRYLVTASDDERRLTMWRCTAIYANWLDGRENPRGGETWLVTVFADKRQQFLDSARAVHVTVEEIHGGGDDETYELQVGEPGTGWQAPAAGARLVKVDGVLTEGDAEAAREALQQLDADPHGLKAGLIVKAYREHGQEKWVFRCWGTDDGCDGFLSLDHFSKQSAERARDRHLAEEHNQATDGESENQR